MENKKRVNLSDEVMKSVQGGTVGANGISDENTKYKIGERFIFFANGYEIIGINVEESAYGETAYDCKKWDNMFFRGEPIKTDYYRESSIDQWTRV